MTQATPGPSTPSGLQANVIGFAIRFRGIVVAMALVLLGYGVLSVVRAKYDVFPEFAPPQVGIQTEAPGLTPEQIEVLVTQPIENAINGVPGVQSLRSTSIQGLSVITVIFAPGSDIYRDRQVVAERLAVAAQQLPSGDGAAGNDAADLFDEYHPCRRAHLRHALADGFTHYRRLDAAPAASRRAGRRQGRGVRRRSSFASGSGTSGPAHSL